jgi:bifunctional DNA-binding transcriptional regulator/antitoxin component of YhaV-PrlF toxin-antitoxin module
MDRIALQNARMTIDRAKTVVSRRGRTIVPASIRRRHHIEDGSTLIWMDDGRVIKVIPITEDAVTTLRGSGKGEHLVERLLADRRHEQCRR